MLGGSVVRGGMFDMPRTWIRIGALALVAIAFVAGLVIITMPAVRTDGPLQVNSRTNVEYAMRVDETITWGVDLPENPTDSDITILSAELVEPVGLSIVGFGMTRTDDWGGVAAVYGYPPTGAELISIENSMLAAGGRVQFLVGVQRPEATALGTIAGVLVRYAWHGQTYELLLPYSLTINRPDS